MPESCLAGRRSPLRSGPCGPVEKPISPSVARSASESRMHPFNWARMMRFSAARYSLLSARIPSARRLEKIRFNDTARLSHRLRPRHLVSRHMGRDGTSTLAVAPRDHYCGGGIGHCRVASESSAIKPSIPVASLANDLAASLFSRAPTGFVGATAARADCAGSESQTQLRSIDVRWYWAPCRAR